MLGIQGGCLQLRLGSRRPLARACRRVVPEARRRTPASGSSSAARPSWRTRCTSRGIRTGTSRCAEGSRRGVAGLSVASTRKSRAWSPSG
eukprot:14169671-Alexandrium_andersonii.AAC.1